jgi:hypothetical protein
LVLSGHFEHERTQGILAHMNMELSGKVIYLGKLQKDILQPVTGGILAKDW